MCPSTTQHMSPRPLPRREQLARRARYLSFGVLFALFTALAATTSTTAATVPGATIPGTRAFLPFISDSVSAVPPPVYVAIPVLGAPVDRPAESNGDLNLALRGYITATAPAELINLDGPTDSDPPQLAGLFGHTRMPEFVATYRVHDWDWSCGPDGCRGAPIETPPATLLEVAATAGELVYIPSRNAEIYGGGFRAMVLYAAPTRLTLTYTREDTPAIGYMVHLEDLAVEASLVALYEEMNAAGRGQLPALRPNEHVGRVAGTSIKVVIRDTGSLMDPRSRKDWWQGYLHGQQ